MDVALERKDQKTHQLLKQAAEERSFAAQVDSEGNQALHRAAQSGNQDWAQVLIQDFKANPFKANAQGKTAVALAEASNHKALASCLKTMGNDSKAQWPQSLEQARKSVASQFMEIGSKVWNSRLF